MQRIFFLPVFIILLSFVSATAQQPAGDELLERINMTAQRLLEGTEPTFTPDFILADVEPGSNGKRRFDNFHGDLSGRYLSAIALLPEKERPAAFPQLLKQLLALQQPDGRFGRSSVSFEPDSIGAQQMALLWGNGRLLVGLMDYYDAYPDKAVLDAGKRLGNFMLGIIKACSSPAMVKKLEGMAAYGYICFTQLNEGLVMLSARTKDPRYALATKQIYPWLPPRGIQHTHGYLCTLRGVMELYSYRPDTAALAFAEKHYRSLVTSSDYMPFGGVNEYFGSQEQHRQRLRDEGCAEADLMGLSFQLWQATGRMEYLEKAEYCLLNELSFNQFSNGDFGHHLLDGRAGYQLENQLNRAWWCCTMHGLRFLVKARQHIITREGNLRKVNLFFEQSWQDEQLGLQLQQAGKGSCNYLLAVTGSRGASVPLAIRRPSWCSSTELLLNGQALKPLEKDGYLVVERKWQKGDRLEIKQEYRLSLVTPDGRSLDPAGITRRQEGYLHYGPYLLAADGNAAAAFLGEPATNNVIYAGSIKPAATAPAGARRAAAYLTASYRHDGFPGSWQVTLRPIGELAFEQRTYFKALLKFGREE